jgi:hypothetical protein
MDGIKPLLDAIKEGVTDSSSATIPGKQGSMCILLLWQRHWGFGSLRPSTRVST